MNLYIHEKNLHKCIKTQSLKMFMKKVSSEQMLILYLKMLKLNTKCYYGYIYKISFKELPYQLIIKIES